MIKKKVQSESTRQSSDEIMTLKEQINVFPFGFLVKAEPMKKKLKFIIVNISNWI